MTRTYAPPPRRNRLLDGKYELLVESGSGGMATVWRARMLGAAGFERIVAVKKMHQQLRDSGEYLRMFVEEARVGSQLTHQNIVQVYDFCGNESDGYYLVMEWVEGTSLKRLMEALSDPARPPPWDMGCYAIACTLRGLSAAHDRLDAAGHPSPIIHRDVTPANVLCSVNGAVKLGDFGLARAEDRMDQNMTQPGMVKGKLSYTAPEILQGGKPSELTDVFSTGVCLWEVLSGRRLFHGKSDVETFGMILDGATPRLDTLRRDLPDGLSDLCVGALDPSPRKRPRSALEMADRLDEMLRQAPVQSFRDRLGEAVRQVCAAGE